MKLIDAGALKSRLKKQDARTFAIEELNLLVDFAPTIDAVPVVWCKNCKHRYITGSTTHYYVCDFMDAEYNDNGYCHHGERKDDED